MVSLFEGPATASPGESIEAQVNTTATNSGDVAAGEFAIGFYLSTDPTITTDDTLLIGGREFVSSLAAGQQVEIPTNMLIPEDFPAGTYYLGVLLDEFDAVPHECDENNNFAAIPIEILGPVCGNDSCDLDEGCEACPTDCGECPLPNEACPVISAGGAIANTGSFGTVGQLAISTIFGTSMTVQQGPVPCWSNSP